MSTEILPSSSDGIEESTQRVWTPDRGEEITTTKTGPGTPIYNLYTAAIRSAESDQTLASLGTRVEKGRGTYTIVRVPELANDLGVQELIAMEVQRDIVLAPYFKTLTVYEVRAVIKAIRDDVLEVDVGWVDLQKTLFRHLAFGRTVYYETAFVFRRSRRVAAVKRLDATMTGINQVGELPVLAGAITNLIATLPAGEWLKKPPKLRFFGREGWEVSEDWQWAPEWSVVYGGSWTGAP